MFAMVHSSCLVGERPPVRRLAQAGSGGSGRRAIVRATRRPAFMRAQGAINRVPWQRQARSAGTSRNPRASIAVLVVICPAAERCGNLHDRRMHTAASPADIRAGRATMRRVAPEHMRRKLVSIHRMLRCGQADAGRRPGRTSAMRYCGGGMRSIVRLLDSDDRYLAVVGRCLRLMRTRFDKFHADRCAVSGSFVAAAISRNYRAPTSSKIDIRIAISAVTIEWPAWHLLCTLLLRLIQN